MKKVFSPILLPALLAIGLAARPGDVLRDLKLSPEQVSEQVFEQLTDEYPSLYLPYETRQAVKQLSSQARASAVRALYPVVRTYVQSEDFRSRYDSWLRNKYHVSAESSSTESAADLKAVMNEQLDKTMAGFSSMPAQLLAIMLQEQITQLQEQMRQADAPGKGALNRDLMVLRQMQPLANTKPDEFKTQYLAFVKRYMARQMEQGMEDEEERLAQQKAQAEERRAQEAEYRANADPNKVLRKRLRDFIALAESVDFDAKTEKQGYRTEFVRDDYRNQSREWKQLYRIGREPVLAARDLARTWLNELK